MFSNTVVFIILCFLIFFSAVDTPDPYIKLRLRKSPEGRQRTRTIDNEINPVWDETFTFFMDSQNPEGQILGKPFLFFYLLEGL